MANKPNVFNYIDASVRFVLFITWAVINIPFAAINPGGKWGVRQFRVLMWVGCKLCKFRYCVRGELSKSRPLLMVGNHIGVWEFAVMPAALGINFFGKASIAKMFFIGFFARKMGVQFIDRNPRKAVETVKHIKEFTERASYPMVIFPEGISTNGAYVHPFKSSLFNIFEPQLNGDADAAQFTVQPFVMYYRDKAGCKLSDDDLAEIYAGFDPAKMLQGRNDVPMRNDFVQLFQVMTHGGLTMEIELLPPPSLDGINNRHELSEMLNKIIEQKYMSDK